MQNLENTKLGDLFPVIREEKDDWPIEWDNENHNCRDKKNLDLSPRNYSRFNWQQLSIHSCHSFYLIQTIMYSRYLRIKNLENI